ncbi:MAG TPA: type II secretion system protein GspN [Deltaproteobacteria bacterium]|nr:type II secretion system protein GspN [Deltaproteobacteria bacterium]
MGRVKTDYSFRTKAGFIVYALFCLIIFVYFRFPYDLLKDRFEHLLSAALGSEVTLGHMHAHLPLALAADGLKINTFLLAKRIVFHPRIVPLLAGELGVDISAGLVSGGIEGFIKTPLKSMGDPFELVLDVESADAAIFSQLFPANARSTGIITGHGEFQGPSGSIEKAHGAVSLQVRDGTIPLNIPNLPLDMISFKALDVDARMDKGMLTIEKAELNGDISGTLQGAVRVRDRLGMSRLNLTGELIVPDAMRNMLGAGNLGASSGIKFSLRGTADKPLFRMLNR